MDKNASCSMKAECCDAGGGGKGGCCFAPILKGAILGGIILFAVYFISWMYLPWHQASLKGFSNEAAVAKALDAGTSASGVYILPFMQANAEAPAVTKPYAFVSVVKEGMDMKAYNMTLAKEALLCLVLAALLTCLLKKQGAECCPIRASFKISLLVALAHYVPNMIFMGFPLDYSLIGMADDIIAITVAGYVIRRFVIKAGSCA